MGAVLIERGMSEKSLPYLRRAVEESDYRDLDAVLALAETELGVGNFPAAADLFQNRLLAQFQMDKGVLKPFAQTRLIYMRNENELPWRVRDLWEKLHKSQK
jgi:hypothetical protein